MRVWESVGGRGWLLTDLWVLERDVAGNETSACHAMPCHGTRRWRTAERHSLNQQYGMQPLVEQSPQQREGDGQLSEIS
jgi:hypothetical protein